MDTEQLIDVILTRNQIAIDEDQQLKTYIDTIFTTYHDKNTANLIYSIATNPKFKYWISIQNDDNTVVWHPVVENFNGVYEISRSVLKNSVEDLAFQSRWGKTIDMKNLTPIEWFAIKTTPRGYGAYGTNFSSRCSTMFYRYVGDKREDVQIHFEKTLIASLELSLKMFKPSDYTKIEF